MRPPALSSAEISVIVVNYETADLAIEAVESVLGQNHHRRTVDVHLVDNASPGGDAEALTQAHADRDWGKRVTLYLEKTNHGFGRGNNLVLRALDARDTPPQMVMLLNPDARLFNEAIAILADALEAHPIAGFAGAGISKPDGTVVTAAFRFPNAVNEFSQALNFGPVARLCKRWQVPLPATQPHGPVDWVSGAAVLIRFDALRQVGFFDPAFFLYFEEVDLMRQAARIGWQAWYVPEAKVVHAEGAATGVKSGQPIRRPAYWYHSWQYYFRKHHGRVGAILAGTGWMLGAAGDRVIARLRGQQVHGALHLFRDFWAAGMRPLLGLKARSFD